jgi:hypothetical protein
VRTREAVVGECLLSACDSLERFRKPAVVLNLNLLAPSSIVLSGVMYIGVMTIFLIPFSCNWFSDHDGVGGKFYVSRYAFFYSILTNVLCFFRYWLSAG